MNSLPTPHGDKLKILLQNHKLPSSDYGRVEQALQHYENWRKALGIVQGDYPERISQMVALLNDYKQYIELQLIFDSPEDFLYRQKGQLKLDNTILEEFLPILVASTLTNQLQSYGLVAGPTTCFSGLRFESAINKWEVGGGMKIRAKDHDFALSRPLFVRTSHEADFKESLTEMTHLAYITAECKTNLDKTMFQEAAATALDVKMVMSTAKYFLLCEWLDMTPISTNTTAIDEIIILRKAKRLSAHIRSQFNTVEGRQKHRQVMQDFLMAHPLVAETFTRFLDHIQNLLIISSEDDILAKGYF